MPFKSEKQRRYLWANEPEIARDWTDTYGSGIAKALGGRIPFANGSDWLNMGNIAKYGGATVGGLGMGAGYQTLKDINQINKWSQMGYGNRNPVPQSMLKNLTGAYVPNQTFKKLGYGPGSLKGWLTSRVSPTHFGPVEAAMNVGKHLGTLGGTVATGIPLAYASLAGALQKNIPEELQGVISDDIISGGAMGAAAGQNPEWDAILRGSTANPDFLYNPKGDKGTMDANVFPTTEANVSDPSLVQPHDFEFGNQWQTAEEEDDSGNWLTKALSYMPLVGKNTRSGAFMRMLTNTYMPEGRGIANFANTMRGGLTQKEYARAREARRTVNRVKNMMARKEAGKSYSKTNLANLSAQISGGRDPSQGNTVTGHGKSGMGRDPRDRMARGGLAGLWQR